MKIQFIRNATLKIWYGGKCFLIDPYFAPKFSQPSFSGKSANPLVDLPVPVDTILKGIDYVLISHLHPDHFDESAIRILPKAIPVYCQPEDKQALEKEGFINVHSIYESFRFDDVIVHRIKGQHGEGQIEQLMGPVSGFIFQHKQEKTLYWTGDTIWYEALQETIFDFSPEVIVCHAGGNRFFKEYPVFGDSFQDDSEPVIMDAKQVVELSYYALTSKIIATHIGALDHETISREFLREYTQLEGISPNQLFIPQEGDLLNF